MNNFCFKCKPVSMETPHSNVCFQKPPPEFASSASDETIKEFTLCTYNVGWNVDIKQLLQFLEEEAPTVVCIQEMIWDKGVMRLIKSLRGSTWSNYTCYNSPRTLTRLKTF